jgi:hypothetical protein
VVAQVLSSFRARPASNNADLVVLMQNQFAAVARFTVAREFMANGVLLTRERARVAS